MGGAIGGLIGGALGFAVGGPAGAMVGMSAGGLLGGASGGGGGGSVNVNVPGPSASEQQLIDLQVQQLQRQLAPPTEEELAIQEKMTGYYDQILSDETLSEDEEAAFDQEYELQYSALEDQYSMETERFGGQRMAELVSRGVLESTTGYDAVASDQQRFAGVFAENISELGQAKELAKSDFGAAKDEMARQGYRLTSGLFQSQQSDALNTAAGLQNHFTQQNMFTANAALQNAMNQQMFSQNKYNQTMSGLGTMTGFGISQMARS